MRMSCFALIRNVHLDFSCVWMLMVLIRTASGKEGGRNTEAEGATRGWYEEL